METKLNIYPTREKVFERELRKLKGSDISQRNKELITEFQNYLFSTGSGELRVCFEKHLNGSVSIFIMKKSDRMKKVI